MEDYFPGNQFTGTLPRTDYVYYSFALPNFPGSASKMQSMLTLQHVLCSVADNMYLTPELTKEEKCRLIERFAEDYRLLNSK